jgi:hypothetical protein
MAGVVVLVFAGAVALSGTALAATGTTNSSAPALSRMAVKVSTWAPDKHKHYITLTQCMEGGGMASGLGEKPNGQLTCEGGKYNGESVVA